MQFYYDFISPNAYLAWRVLPDIARLHERELVLKPVLFAGLLQAHHQVGPAEVAPKMQWMVRNCLRKAINLGIPFAPPHSLNPLLTLRLVLACEDGDRERLTDVLFDAVWAESRDVSDVDSVSRLLSSRRFDADRMLALAQSPSIKSRLRAETDMAVSKGVFGVPTVIVDEELFFGFDDFPWLERHLRGEDSIDESQYANWQKVRPSAWRTRK